MNFFQGKKSSVDGVPRAEYSRFNQIKMTTHDCMLQSFEKLGKMRRKSNGTQNSHMVSSQEDIASSAKRQID